jgi:hypothetical protein
MGKILMKFHKKIKIETVVLIFAALILGNRELLHPFFHTHSVEIVWGYNACSDKNTFLESSERHSQEDFLCSHTCPLCSNPSGKYASLNPAVYSLPVIESINYSFGYSNIFFKFRLEEVSRGPPLQKIIYT